jgi:hypothetical protein
MEPAERASAWDRFPQNRGGGAVGGPVRGALIYHTRAAGGTPLEGADRFLVLNT